VSGARAELASRLDLASLRNVAPQARSILVVDLADLVDAEAADFAPSTKAAATTAARPTSPGAPRATSASPATWAVTATGTIAAAEWTVTLGAGSESGTRRVAI
jgi:hypothetical protein